MGRLDGKIAIVTGAGRGIGRAIALRYAAEGAKVVVASRSGAAVEAVTREIQASGAQALGITCNVSRQSDILAMVACAVERFGPIDVLVNNAHGFGIAQQTTWYPIDRPLEEIPNEEWDYQIQVGLMGTLWCMKAVFPHMRDRGGKIINFGSLAGQRGQVGTAHYNVSKEAIRALSRTAAREWARYKININVINPAARTDALSQFLIDHPTKASARSTPLGPLEDPIKNIAPVAVFLACADSDFITGMTMMADGGLLISP